MNLLHSRSQVSAYVCMSLWPLSGMPYDCHSVSESSRL